MASENSNQLKQLLFELLSGDLQNNNYYVGLSRADAFSAGTSISSVNEQKKLRHALQSVKTVSNISFVVPSVIWQSGTVYNQFDNDDANQTNFYVMNSANEVFVCIARPNTVVDGEVIGVNSTIEPTATLASNNAKSFRTSDGYFWRYLYKNSNLAISNYNTSEWLPVKQVLAGATIPEEVEQFALQQAAVDGELVNLAIDSTGSSYTSFPSQTIAGNGLSAQFRTVVDPTSGKVISAFPDSDQNGLILHGQDYDYASVTLGSGGNNDAVLRPIYAPEGGLNANPVETLKARSIMIQADIQADESSTLLVENDFAQVCLLRNPKKFGSDSDFASNTGNVMKFFTISGLSGGTKFPADAEIEVNSNSNIRAKVFWQDSASSSVYYYQDETTGFESFTVGQIITDQTVSATIDVINNPDVDAYTGEILSINNISTSISRSNTQTEDIKIVLKLDNCS